MNRMNSFKIQIPQLITTVRSQQSGSMTSRDSVDHTQKNLLKRYAKRQIIQQCMNSLDLFTNMMNESEQQTKKLRRDVQKSITIQIYNQNQIIYDIGQEAQKLFLVIEGSASVLIQKNKPLKSLNKNHYVKQRDQNQQIEYEQVNVYQQGRGFGQGQFISRRKRDVRVVCKSQILVVGILFLNAFKQVVQNYRLRVYYKKRDRYQQCPFFQHLSQDKLQFVINNSKIIKLKKGQILFKENSKVKYLYLLTKGQLILFKKNCKKLQEGQYYTKRVFSKKYLLPLKNVRNQMMIGILQKDNFIGDMQLVLNKNYQFSAACESLQAQIYACDTRIVLNQISQELLQELDIIYQNKKNFYEDRVKKNQFVKDRYKNQHQDFLKPQLTKLQLEKKRKLKRKYVQKIPSAIGSSSAKDIERLIIRKKSLLSPQAKSLQFPVVSVFLSHSSKKRKHSPRSFTPISIVKIPKVRTQISTRNLNYEDQENQSKTLQSQSLIIDLRPIPRKIKLENDENNKYVQNLKKIIKGSTKNPEMKQINEAIKKMKKRLLSNSGL